MKKLYSLLALAAVLLVTTVSAQNYEKNIFSIRGGMNIAEITAKSDGITVTTDSRIAYHIGVTDQILLCKRIPLYLEPGLFLSSRGGKVNKFTLSPLYLQVPVVLTYHFNIKDKVSIEPFAGIYYGLGIGGKAKLGKEKTDVFSDEGGMSRSDFGVRVGAGVVFLKHFYAGLGYEIGCANIAKENEAAKFHSNCMTVSVGYKF